MEQLAGRYVRAKLGFRSWYEGLRLADDSWPAAFEVTVFVFLGLSPSLFYVQRWCLRYLDAEGVKTT